MKGSGATQSSGRSRGSVGVTPTGIEIGLDLGIGQLGISTDYGGGIVVGIGGQKIVWGREGGKIHYNLGGFEVLVEARNCVVTETRKIAGQIVGINVYPDPGCKTEEDWPKPPSDDLPIRESTNNPKKIPTSKKCPGGRYELVGVAWSADDTRSRLYPLETALQKRDQLGEQRRKEAEEFAFADREWGKNNWVFEINNVEEGTGGGQWIFFKDEEHYEGRLGSINKFDGVCSRSWKYNIYYGKPRGFYAFSGGGYDFKSVIDRVSPPPPCPILEPPPPPPPPPPGNQPPMPDRCCASLKADIEDIMEVLAVKEIQKGQWTFPWELRMPGGKGNEVIFDYPNYLRAMSQMIDHLGIHPPKLSIKDINNAIAGDQGLNNQFPSATQGFEALMAQVWDANADVDTLTNFLYRLSWLNVQQSMNLAKLSAKIEVISDMLGGETEPSESTITTPFNIGAGIKEKSTKGQGFGKTPSSTINTKIDANTEIATESLLPNFLKIRENPIVTEKFSGAADINDKIDLIILKLESLQRG
jgi:hypothetical protein